MLVGGVVVAVLLVSLLLALDPSARRSSSPSSASPAAAPRRPAPTGLFEGRPYRLFVPDRPVTRLVVALHPLYGGPDGFQKLTRWDGFAAARGWAVLYPAGLHGSWNAGACCGFARRQGIDDVGYLVRLIRSVRTDLSLGSGTTDLTGYSNGGMLALEMMCDAPAEVSAVAVVAASLQVPFCGAARPFLMIRGASDTTVPPTGGPSTTAQAILYPDFAGLRLILAAARCQPRIAVSDEGRVQTSTLSCGGQVLGTYLRIQGQGHGYPSGGAKAPLDATARIADYFDVHP